MYVCMYVCMYIKEQSTSVFFVSEVRIGQDGPYLVFVLRIL